MFQKNSTGEVQPLSDSFVVQIRELKTPLLPSFLSSSIVKIVVYFLFSNNFTHMAREAHRAWSDITSFSTLFEAVHYVKIWNILSDGDGPAQKNSHVLHFFLLSCFFFLPSLQWLCTLCLPGLHFSVTTPSQSCIPLTFQKLVAVKGILWRCLNYAWSRHAQI